VDFLVVLIEVFSLAVSCR